MDDITYLNPWYVGVLIIAVVLVILFAALRHLRDEAYRESLTRWAQYGHSSKFGAAASVIAFWLLAAGLFVQWLLAGRQ